LRSFQFSSGREKQNGGGEIKALVREFVKELTFGSKQRIGRRPNGGEQGGSQTDSVKLAQFDFFVGHGFIGAHQSLGHRNFRYRERKAE
jgi:hypothetical protein